MHYMYSETENVMHREKRTVKHIMSPTNKYLVAHYNSSSILSDSAIIMLYLY